MRYATHCPLVCPGSRDDSGAGSALESAPLCTRSFEAEMAPTGSQESVKFGSRFSTKAAMPSDWSFVASVEWKRRRS